MINLAYFLTWTARRQPEALAVVQGAMERPYRWLDERVGRMAGALTGLGLNRGDRVGLVVDIEPRALESLLAPLRAGLVIVPMNPKLHPSEHAFMLRDCGARAVICSRPRLDALLAVRDAMPAVEHIVAMDAAQDLGGTAAVADYDALLAAARPLPDARVEADDLAWIFYTSGTTGRPKGAMHGHGSLRAMVDAQLIQILPTQPDDRIAHLTPMSHAAGLLSFHQIAAGGAQVFATSPHFEAESFYRFVERHRVTKAMLVPTMIQRLLDAPWPPPCDISSLKTVMYGAAPMYVDRLKEALARFGPIFVGVFAQGEAPLACTCLEKREHLADGGAGERRLASVGRECYGVQVGIVDEHGREQPPETTGEIVVRGEIVMKGYWNSPEASAETLRGGWLHTGDVGHMDADGYLYITDRLKDMIIKGGTNIYPREIEEVLYRHPAVNEATVFGIPDPHWGEQVIAAVALNPGLAADAQALGDWCVRHLAPFKKPAHFHFLPELAKSGYGKILKREVRTQLYPGPGEAGAGATPRP